ncbi:MAG: hypothetical protein ABSG43_17490, partial [Solirubrobacteraceae bacterium]
MVAILDRRQRRTPHRLAREGVDQRQQPSSQPVLFSQMMGAWRSSLASALTGRVGVHAPDS